MVTTIREMSIFASKSIAKRPLLVAASICALPRSLALSLPESGSLESRVPEPRAIRFAQQQVRARADFLLDRRVFPEEVRRALHW
jgi:hypothetical protein